MCTSRLFVQIASFSCLLKFVQSLQLLVDFYLLLRCEKIYYMLFSYDRFVLKLHNL